MMHPSKQRMRGVHWVSILSVYIGIGIISTYFFGSGIFYVELLEKYGEGEVKTNLVGTLNASLTSLLAPLASIFVNRVSCRSTIVAGSIMIAVGLFLSAWATNVTQIILTYGICAGIGNALLTMAFPVVLGYCGDKRRNLALSAGSVLAGLGLYLSTPISLYLIDQYGIDGTYILLSGLNLQICIVGVLCKPSDIELELKRQREIKREVKSFHSSTKCTGFDRSDVAIIYNPLYVSNTTLNDPEESGVNIPASKNYKDKGNADVANTTNLEGIETANLKAHKGFCCLAHKESDDGKIIMFNNIKESDSNTTTTRRRYFDNNTADNGVQCDIPTSHVNECGVSTENDVKESYTSIKDVNGCGTINDTTQINFAYESDTTTPSDVNEGGIGTINDVNEYETTSTGDVKQIDTTAKNDIKESGINECDITSTIERKFPYADHKECETNNTSNDDKECNDIATNDTTECSILSTNSLHESSIGTTHTHVGHSMTQNDEGTRECETIDTHSECNIAIIKEHVDKPPNGTKSTTRQERSLKSPVFILFVFGTFVWNLVFGIVMLNLPNYMQIVGKSGDAITVTMACFSVSNNVGRFLSMLASIRDLFDGLFISIVTLFIGGFASAGFPWYSELPLANEIFAGIIGFIAGAPNGMMMPVAVRLLGLAKLSTALAILALFSGVGLFVGPVIASALLEVSGSYSSTFIFVGGVSFAGSIASLCAKLLLSRTTRKSSPGQLVAK